MKRVLIILLTIIFLISCNHKIYNIYNDSNITTYGVSQKNQYEKNFTYEQFDSICRVDKISNNLEKKWHKVKFFNPHTRDNLIQYLYIKNMDKEQHIYRVQLTQYEDSLKITKRIEK